jgi:DNA repair exonuclease SbcCD ATPase subunit
MLDWNYFIAGAAMLAALVMTALWRRSLGRATKLSVEGEGVAARLAESEKGLAREQKARNKLAEEIAEFRKRTDKAKRRGAKAAPQPMGTAARMQDLEEASAQAGRERDRLRQERDSLTEELARLRRQLEAQSRPAPSAPSPSPVPVAEVPDDDAAKRELEANLATAREQIGKLEGEHRIARQNEARMRKRMDNQEQLYASLRSELEVKKDRLRTQEEQIQRLQALKAAILD